ncbi:CoA transferase [Ornithinimicrobium humiphilum]|uniref:Formyl-CoA transferase n=1 Tax=Ornithinimicrobium humiphilum TaxID=125288 RepID=A0A543KL96_9MICO|nr:CoA transferase [Ornithinimicrobium humiphilum]TQM95869.1 formyl-CoA transferase [Ornithinimicrobium humiphilum]
MTAPLEGITVVEVGVFMAAPFAAMQLADLGARVIKVESPDRPDPTRQVGPMVQGRSSPFLRLNRNKESVALDFKSPEGREALLALVGVADVFLENLRPGALVRAGLGPDDLLARNPRLIYCSASGWGQTGPLAPQPGLDIMAQARSGLMSITGEPDGDPVKLGIPVADLSAGLYCTIGILAALRDRDRTGRGDVLDVSLYESAVSLAVWEAGKHFGGARAGGRHGSAHQSQAPYQAMPTRDGYVTFGAITPATWEALCRVLGAEDLLADERYATSQTRFDHRDELIPALERHTRALGSQELLDLLEEAGVPCAPVAELAEVFDSEHLREREFFWDAESDELGPQRQLGSPVNFRRLRTRRDNPGPDLGADTERVLGTLGLPGRESVRAEATEDSPPDGIPEATTSRDGEGA